LTKTGGRDRHPLDNVRPLRRPDGDSVHHTAAIPARPQPSRSPVGATPSSALARAFRKQGDEPAKGPGYRWKLRHVLFLCLLLSGIIPLAIGSLLLINQNQSILIDQQREYLVNSAEALARQIDIHLIDWRQELVERGEALLTLPGPVGIEDRLREGWVEEFLRGFVRTQEDVLSVRALNLAGEGPRMAAGSVPTVAQEALNTAFDEALEQRSSIFRLADTGQREVPLLALAVPVFAGREEPQLIMESLNRLALSEFFSESGQGVGVLLADSAGRVLWADEGGQMFQAAVEASGHLATAGASAFHYTERFEVVVGGEEQEIQMTVSPIGEVGWQVAVLKPIDVAFAAVNRVVTYTLAYSLVLVLVSMGFAAYVARRVGEPLHRLAETTHAIAAGNFGRRLDTSGFTLEMADLAENFNRMSGHVESHIEQLKRAAQMNRELFIGSIRAFAATIDAKDPYTRGHSERVAAVSKAVARHMGLDEEFQQRVWLGALLHDVGKIGIDDRVLKKGDVLTPEEYEQMKLHTVIGAEIVGRLDQLKEIVPAVRWHHENWNGKGYPDGLKGEQIPLIARIICVADTFDAVTTSRPYQQAYTLEFAVNTITKLTGTRFDAKVVTAFLSAFNAGNVEAAIEQAPGPTEEISVGVMLSV